LPSVSPEVKDVTAALASIEKPVFIVDEAEGAFLAVNPAFESLTGYRCDELRGARSLDLIDLEDREAGRQCLKNVVHESSGSIRLGLFTRCGHVLCAQCAGKKMICGDKPAVMVVVEASDTPDRPNRAQEGIDAVSRALMDTAPDLIIIKSHCGGEFRYLKVNRAFEEFFGVTESEITGHTDFEVLDAENAKVFHRLDTMAVQAESGPVHFRGISFPGAPGAGERLFDIVEAPVADASGRVVMLAAIGRDMTGHYRLERRLRESEEQYRALVENSFDMIFTLDERGAFTYASSASWGITGFWREELRGFSIYDYLTDEDAEHMRGALAQVLRGQTVRNLEVSLRQKDGSTAFLEANLTPLQDPDGKVTGVHGIARDVTPRARLEQQKEHWYSLLTHDLRSPIASARSWAEMLTDPVYRDKPQVREKAEARVVQGLDDALQTLEVMVNFGRLKRGDVTPDTQPMDIFTTLLDVTKALTPDLEEKELVLTINHRDVEEAKKEKLQILANPALLRMVLENLVGNAVKYARRGINVSIVAQEGHLVIAVEDDGPGIAEEYQDHIFDEYYQITGSKPGTGLGLASVKLVAREHGGDCWVVSSPGQGSAFFFKIPLP